MSLLEKLEWTGTQDYGNWAVERGEWVVVAMPATHAAELVKAAERGRENGRDHGIDPVLAAQAASTMQQAVDAWGAFYEDGDDE